MMSTRTPRPPIDPMTCRRALAVRPPRPITVPRSSGCTRTSSRWPRRESIMRTRTSSGLWTMPLTRCSRAGRSASERRADAGSARRIGAGTRRLLGRSLLRLRRGLLGCLGGLGGLGLGCADAGGGLRLSLVDRRAVGAGRRDLQRLGRCRQALELLPVACLRQDRPHRIARLRADAEPVLHPIGLDLDARGLLLRVIDPDLLDRPAVTLGARIGDDDAVLRVADLSHPQKPDAYGHCVLLLRFEAERRRPTRGA